MSINIFAEHKEDEKVEGWGDNNEIDE